MTTFVECFFLIYLILENVIETQFELPSWYSYWDESIFLILLFVWIFNILWKKYILFKTKNDKKIFILVLLIIIIGILGNIVYRYNNGFYPLLFDIVGFAKFPLAYVFIRGLNIDKVMASKVKYILPFLKLFVLIMFFLGLISLKFNLGMSQEEYRYGIHPYMFLFSHPTIYAFANILAFALIGPFLNKKNKFFYTVAILMNILLSFRTKAIALIVVYLFLSNGSAFLKKKGTKLFYIVLAISVAFIVSISKIEQYLAYSISPREYNYLGMLEIIRKCFPIGSGFATFASSLAAKTGSALYSILNIKWAFGPLKATFIVESGDTGYPYYFGEFGIIGGLLFLSILFYIYRNISMRSAENHLYSLTLYLYILIALTAESILLNYGITIAFVLNIVYQTECQQNIQGKLRRDIL